MSVTPWNSIAEGMVNFEERRLTYSEALVSPCKSCRTAPCCSHLPLKTFKITNLVDLDHALYTLNFERIVLGVHASGDWSIYYSYPCRFLNRDGFTCDIHEAPERPQICAHYNPYRCWYKKPFTGAINDTFMLIDRQRMETILPKIVFDESRNIIQVPDWATLVDGIASLPLVPHPPSGEVPEMNPAIMAWKNIVLGLDCSEAIIPETCGYNDLKDLCSHCQSFCCKVLLFPVDVPRSIANLDYFKFCLSFPGVELGIANGAWSLVINTTCRHLKDNLCSIYERPERPLICQHHDAWRCDYRMDFGQPRPPDFLRLTLEQFDWLSECVRFDGNGAVVTLPSIEDIRNHIEESWLSTEGQPDSEAAPANFLSP
jgi:hypothetical protein